MKVDNNTRILIALLAISIVSISLHRAGFFNTYFDLLSREHPFGYVTNGDNRSYVKHHYENNTLTMRCTLKPGEGYRYCGTAIKINEDPALGIDLSGYQNIFIDVDYQSPEPDSAVRILFRNFDPIYANRDDASSLKYNTIQFRPNEKKPETAIPTSSFLVATWWINEYKVSYEHTQTDLTNVSLVEIETAEAQVPGEYIIHVRSLVLQGHLFSESSLLKSLLALWLLASIYMVRRQHRALTLLTHQDPLTNLMNRRGLNRWLDKYFSASNSNKDIVMFYIDIDDFKTINDSYGHLVGDHLLCEFCSAIGEQLEQVEINKISKNHALARLSGDEFALMIDGINDKHVTEIANRLISRFSRIISVDGLEITVNASIGIARNPKDQRSAAALMGSADAAMYHSKKGGKNQYKIFDTQVHEDITFRKHVSSNIRQAIERRDFEFAYMPIYCSQTLKVKGAEVLLRTTSPDLKGIGPEIFIPIAEEYGLIRDIDLIVIETTFQRIAQRNKQGLNDDCLFCINISALELHNRKFPDQLQKLLIEYSISANQIELEITETSLIDVDENSINLLRELRYMGFHLALDDFGTGYTGFNQLTNYPVTSLKIDRSFVSKLHPSNDDTTMVDAVIALANSYELNVIAEGVESAHQVRYLTDKGCEFLQGNYLSKPLTWEQFQQFLATKTEQFSML